MPISAWICSQCDKPHPDYGAADACEKSHPRITVQRAKYGLHEDIPIELVVRVGARLIRFGFNSMEEERPKGN